MTVLAVVASDLLITRKFNTYATPLPKHPRASIPNTVGAPMLLTVNPVTTAIGVIWMVAMMSKPVAKASGDKVLAFGPPVKWRRM